MTSAGQQDISKEPLQFLDERSTSRVELVELDMSTRPLNKSSTSLGSTTVELERPPTAVEEATTAEDEGAGAELVAVPFDCARTQPTKLEAKKSPRIETA